MIEVLQDFHCRQPTLTQLQQKLFRHSQSKDEDVDEYAHVLTELLVQTMDVSSDVIQDKNSTLKAQFAEGMYDSTLRRELKRLNTERQSLKFHELRENARKWMDNVAKPKLRQEATALPEKTVHSEAASESMMMKLHETQQEQLKELMKTVKQLQSGQVPARPWRARR